MVIFCGLSFSSAVYFLIIYKDMEQGSKNIRLKSALVVIPLSLCCCDYINETTPTKAFKMVLSYSFLRLFVRAVPCIQALLRHS